MLNKMGKEKVFRSHTTEEHLGVAEHTSPEDREAVCRAPHVVLGRGGDVVQG